MKASISLILALIAFSYNAYSQNRLTPAPIGFDIVRESIPHGKIDTITYFSKTVGNKRKALIYTPPGFSKEKKISGTLLIARHWWRRKGMVQSGSASSHSG